MKVGKIALLGRPNSGKSTLMNACIGENLAPVSNIANTTRIARNGIYSDETTQIIFVDAPGFQGETSLFSRYIRKETLTSLRQSQAILRVIDVSRERGEEDQRIDELISFTNLPVIEIFTKTDLRNIQTVPSGALKTDKLNIPVAALIQKISEVLPDGDYIFDPDLYTDSPPEELLPDIIRMECFTRLKQEIPHSLYVRVEDVEDSVDIVKILAYVVVESDSQKRIVIGTKASVIQTIGTEARKKIEDLYGKKVFIQLRVVVEPNWTKNQKTLKSLFPHV